MYILKLNKKHTHLQLLFCVPQYVNNTKYLTVTLHWNKLKYVLPKSEARNLTAQSYQPQSDILCFQMPQASYFLDFPDSWFSLSKTKMRTRAQVFVTGGDAGGDVTSFTVMIFVLTRWQCSVGIFHDKFHQTWHKFRNFLSPSCISHCARACSCVGNKNEKTVWALAIWRMFPRLTIWFILITCCHRTVTSDPHGCVPLAQAVLWVWFRDCRRRRKWMFYQPTHQCSGWEKRNIYI